MKKFFLIFVLLVFIIQIKITSAFDSQSRLSAGGGIYNFMKHGDDAFNDSSKMYNIEYHFPKGKKQFIRPLVGFLGTDKSAYYAYFGITTDLYFSKCKCILLTPSLGAGYYEDGDQIRLGHALEFKSEVKVGLDIFENSKLSYSYSHISNNDWGESNPGTDNQHISFSKNF